MAWGAIIAGCVLLGGLAGCRFDRSGLPPASPDRSAGLEASGRDFVLDGPAPVADLTDGLRDRAAAGREPQSAFDKSTPVEKLAVVDLPQVADTKPGPDVLPSCGTSCSSCGGCCTGSCCKTKFTGSSLSCGEKTCTCVFDCAGYAGTCDKIACSGGSTCTVDCTGSHECYPRCSGGSTCFIDCQNNTTECEVKECSGGSKCLLNCAGAKGACSFSACPTAVNNCGNSLFACGRSCP